MIKLTFRMDSLRVLSTQCIKTSINTESIEVKTDSGEGIITFPEGLNPQPIGIYEQMGIYTTAHLLYRNETTPIILTVVGDICDLDQVKIKFTYTEDDDNELSDINTI